MRNARTGDPIADWTRQREEMLAVAAALDYLDPEALRQDLRAANDRLRERDLRRRGIDDGLSFSVSMRRLLAEQFPLDFKSRQTMAEAAE